MKKAVFLMALALLMFPMSVLAGQRSQRMLEKKVGRWQERGDLTTILQRVAHMKPAIDQLCAKHGVDPEVMYGLLMQESCANDEAVDYVFKAGKSSKVHVGLGQLNKDKLPKKIKNDPLRRHFAFEWRDAYRNRIGLARQVKHGNDGLKDELVQAQKLEDKLMSEWAKRDPRFDPRWNLEQTIVFFKYNLRKCGEPGLAIMAHHGGGNDPVRRVQRWAADHGYPVPSSRKVPAFVRKHGLNYFVLYEDRRAGHQYWAKKGDGHLTYAFSPLAGSIVFMEYWKGLAPSVQAKIMGSKVELKKNNAVASTARIKDDKKMVMEDPMAGYNFCVAQLHHFLGNLAMLVHLVLVLAVPIIIALFVCRTLAVGLKRALQDTGKILARIVLFGIPTIGKITLTGLSLLISTKESKISFKQLVILAFPFGRRSRRYRQASEMEPEAE